MPNLDYHTLQTLLKFKMQERPESLCCADVSYNPIEQTLTVEFVKRGTYVYKDVPLDVYVDFHSAGSQGTYFNLYIRNKGYDYERTS